MSGSKPFPLEAFPEWLGSYIASVAQSFQVPMDMPGAFALGVMATAAARTGSVRPFADHVEPLNLFVALVAPPGMKKSACESALFNPVRAFERAMVKDTEPQRFEAAMERARLEKALEEAKEAGDLKQAQDLASQLAAMPPATVPQLTASDVTAQKLGSLLAEHCCMAIVSAEPSIIPTMMGRWGCGKVSSELEIFLQGHAGDAIRVDRLGRPSEFVEHPRLTLAIGLQPESLRSLSSSETAGRGLLARFLYVLPPDVRGKARLRDSRAIPAGHRAEFEAGVRRMLEAQPLAEPIRFTRPATDLWERFVDDFELRLAPGGDMRELHGWGEKFRGQVARIAGGLHLAEGSGAAPLELDTLQRAILLGEWLEGQALQTFGLMNLRADVREANEILEVVTREEWETFTWRRMHQALKDRTRFKRSRDLRRGLDTLVAAGWLTARSDPNGKPGRPSVVFDVHPEVHSEGFEGVSGGLR